MRIQKRDILFKVKEREACNHRNTFVVFRGLQAERDAEIGENSRLWMGTY